MSSNTSTRNRTLVAAVALALGGLAHADEPVRQFEGLGEVVVTAQKRAERSIDVPIAISAITAAAIQDAGAVNLADVLTGVPGVGIIDSGSGQQSIEIRGISGRQGNATVGYYLDELPFSYLGSTLVPDVRTYDLQRIEVLRGPQGTLYGDGSLGGTVRILTNEPDLTKVQASVDLTGLTTKAGSASNSEQGMVNLPIAQNTLALRLVGSHEDLGGWVDNPASGVKDQNELVADTLRAKLRYASGERLDVVLSAWHTKEHVLGDGTSLPNLTSTDPVSLNTTQYDLYSATIRYQFDQFDLVSATSNMRFKNEQNIADYFGFGLFDTVEHENVWSEELRLTSRGAGPFRWSSGVAYRRAELQTNLALPAFGFLQDQFHRSESYALFGEGTWAFTKKLELTVGLRFFKDDQLFREPVDPATLAIIRATDPSFTGTTKPSFHAVNPRINLSYHVTDDWMVYGNIAKGFRTGQAQPVISLELAALATPPLVVPVGIEPETLWSYEAGTKGKLADGKLILEADVFYNHWTNIQTLVFPAPRVGALVNGGPARTQGVEVAVTWQPVGGLTLDLAASTVDAKYLSDVAHTNIHDGDRIPEVPKVSLSAAAMYRWSFTSGLNGFARAGYGHTAPRTDTVNAVPESDTINMLNVRLGVEGSAWGVYLSGDNLTNENGAIDVAQAGNAGQARLRPRTFGLNVHYRYQ